jgi:hypothetical protein
MGEQANRFFAIIEHEIPASMTEHVPFGAGVIA